MTIRKLETSARLHPFMDLPVEKRSEFLSELPSLLESWFTGSAMGQTYQVNAAVFNIKWGHKAFRQFLWWCQWFQQTLPHKDQLLYRMVGIKATNKTQFKMTPGRNPVHSWTGDINAARHLYKVAYQGRRKTDARWTYVIVQTEMPQQRIALNWKQAIRLTEWAIRNMPELYRTAEIRFPLKSILGAWKSLEKRLLVKLIREQDEYICLGNSPVRVQVVEKLQ